MHAGRLEKRALEKCDPFKTLRGGVGNIFVLFHFVGIRPAGDNSENVVVNWKTFGANYDFWSGNFCSFLHAPQKFSIRLHILMLFDQFLMIITSN